MKKKKTKKLHFKKIIPFLGIASMLLFSVSVFAKDGPSEDKPVKKSKETKFKLKAFTSLNNASVRIYPDIIKRDMHVIAKENKKEIDFFVFDVEGTLLHHYKMKDKDHYKISGLARGTYVYRVFSGDEETAAGDFQIR